MVEASILSWVIEPFWRYYTFGEEMRSNFFSVLMLFLAVMLSATAESGVVAQRATPYWASISSDNALMRTGPGRQFPSTWNYVRADLPIKVVQVHEDWRKIEDPDGTQGWMHKSQLSETRTAIVKGAVRPIHADASDGSAIAWRAEPGVVGRISKCTPDWCEIDVRGRGGYIRTGFIWGGSNP